MKHRHLIIVLSLFAGCHVWAAAMPTLPELEARIEGSKAMQILEAEYEIARNRWHQERGRRGASFYSQSSFSDNDEVVDVGRSRSYRQLAGGIGLRVPVLGSRLQWRESMEKHELEVSRIDSERELRRREILRELRSTYATYWASQRYRSLSKDFLEQETPIERSLNLRTRAGLLLDADRLEFMSGFSLAHRDAAVHEANEARALQILQMLVNGEIKGSVARRPMLLPACKPSDSDLASWAAAHPEIRFLRELEAGVSTSLSDSPLYGVNSDIRIGYHASTEWPVEQQGGSAAISWSFDVPINFMNQRKLAQSSNAAARTRAQLERELRQQQLEQELRSLLAQRAVLDQSLHFAALRVAAADESVRERELRAVKLAGDVIEQLQQARLARYNAAKGLIDAELELAHWTAQWSMHAPQGCRSRALYVWSSESIIEELSSGSPIVSAPGGEVSETLLLSLDRSQLLEFSRNPTQLRAALLKAHEQGLRVQLLLGEPTWALPEHRGELLRIVRELRALPFDAVHLDIEPDQLPTGAIDAHDIWSEWLATVRAVRDVTAWPLDVSLHPRYLQQRVQERSLGDHLSDLDASVTLMIYVANAERVIEIAQPLVSEYSSLPMRVALSTEDSLCAEESMHHLSAAERARRIQAIEAGLASPNFRGITIQPSMPSSRTQTVTTAC